MISKKEQLDMDRPLYGVKKLAPPQVPKKKYEDFVTDESNRRMWYASGEIDSKDPLVCFLYLLGRDHLSIGVIEEVLREACTSLDSVMYTNGWLATWADYSAGFFREDGSLNEHSR